MAEQHSICVLNSREVAMTECFMLEGLTVKSEGLNQWDENIKGLRGYKRVCLLAYF
jgi:hypothetical protein